MDVKPLSEGAPLPPYVALPQVLMAPEESNAAKAPYVEAMYAKPLSVGAPLPPYVALPQVLMVPEEPCRAAKASVVVAIAVKPVPEGGV